MPHRGSRPPPVLNLPFLIILTVPILAFLLLFVAVPFTSHKIRPPTIAIKSSWDSLNIFLVLFAILCGIFARRSDDDSTSNDSAPQNNNLSHSDHEKPERPVVSKQWFDHAQDHNRFSNQTVSDTPATGVTRLKRSCSSYPDLRQESFWETGDDRFRFFDDFEIHKYRSPAAASADYMHHRRQRIFDDSEIKEIPVDTAFHSPSSQPQSPAPPPPPPPPLPQTTRQKRSKTYNSVPRREKPSTKVSTPPPPPPPPPRPPPSPLATKIIRSAGKSERKRNNATKEIKMVFVSLYNQRKRKKKQKTKSVSCENDDSSPHSSPEQPSFTQPPPPPPPPPPSVFYNLFRKGSKIKRIHSFSAPPPPPPPPQFKRRSHVPSPPPAPPTLPPRRRNQTMSGRPPLPTGVSNNFYEENVNSGGQSPLIPMPPPPPPPPFRVPGFRFVMKGDFVNIRSGHSSRCGSPDPEEVEKESSEGVITMDGKDGSLGSHFCPSPDVNLKADSFIARLRDEWRLEKVNSWREKGIACHGPGPVTGRGN